MYEVSKFSSENRQMYCTCRIAGGNVAKDYIKSVTLSESAVTNDSIMMGTTNSSTIELELVNITSTIKNRIKKGAVVVPVIYVSDDDFVTPRSISLGKFYIDEVTFTEGYNGASTNASITAYDGFYLTEKEYTPPALENATIRSLVTDICNNQVSSLVMDTDAWSNTINITSVPTGITVRNMLGYLAGLQGCIATFTRTGNLTARWYTPCSKVITAAEQYLSGFENESTEDSIIKYLESGTQDGVLVAGESGVIGTAISFENPMMTQELLDSIYSSKIKVGNNYSITYRPCSVKWRGDPTIELCEIVQVEGADGNNLNLYVMERELSFDGGLYETYKCCIPSETTIAFSKNATMQKLDRKLTAMEKAIKEATDVITQTEGSVFEFISANDPDNPSLNSGWKLHSTINNNVIIANSSGIGFSSNGGESLNAAAIYIDNNGVGHLNANAITVDNLTAGMITFDQNFYGTVNSNVQSDINNGGIVIGNGYITGAGKLKDVLNTQNTKINTIEDKSIFCECTEQPTHINPSSGNNNAPNWIMVIDVDDDFVLTQGAILNVKFTYSIKNTDVVGYLYLALRTKSNKAYINNSLKQLRFNNVRIDSTSEELWAAGATVTFVNTGSTYEMTNSNAGGVALSKVANVDSKIASWALANDTTYIDGSKIYTGTITAEQIKLGWSGGNFASADWTSYYPGYENSFSWNDAYKRFVYTGSYSSTQLIFRGPVMYCAKDSTLLLEGYLYPNGASSIGIGWDYSSTKTGSFTAYPSSDPAYVLSSTSKSFKLTTPATNTGYYRPYIFINGARNGAFIDNLNISYRLSGNMIVQGKIESENGSTYFDLENNALVAANGDVKAQMSVYNNIAGYHFFNGTSYKGGLRYSSNIVGLWANSGTNLVISVLGSSSPSHNIQLGSVDLSMYIDRINRCLTELGYGGDYLLPY